MVIVSFQKEKIQIKMDGELYAEYNYGDVCSNISEILRYEVDPSTKYDMSKKDWFVAWADKDLGRQFGGGRFYIWKKMGERIKKPKLLLGKYDSGEMEITDTTYAKILSVFPTQQVVFDFQFNRE